MSEEAKRRLEALEFWRRHGLVAAAEHAGVSERTLFRWQAAYRKGGERGLEPGSRRPHRIHRRRWPEEVVGEIRRLRTEHPNLGKRKIYPLLKRFCERRRLRCPAVITIGRLIADAGGMRLVPPRLTNRGKLKRPRPKKPRKPKGYAPRRPGDLLAVDTVVAIRDGVRRYLFACIDIRTRFALAVASPGLGSQWSRSFLDVVLEVFPEEVRCVLSDNGSEFEGYFRKRAEERNLGRYFTWPRSPKMNAHCERFNRTVQEEFLIHHEDLLWSDEEGLSEFNRRLAEWLLWYNTERSHEALGDLPPLNALAHEARPRADWLPLRLPDKNFALPQGYERMPVGSVGNAKRFPSPGGIAPTRRSRSRPPLPTQAIPPRRHFPPATAPTPGAALSRLSPSSPAPPKIPDCQIHWACTAS